MMMQLKIVSSTSFLPQGFKESLGDIDQTLASYSYVSGWHPSKKDTEFYNLCSTHENGGYGSWPHLKRWFDHIKSFSSEERSSFPELKQPNHELVNKINRLATPCSGDLDKKVRQ